MDDPFNLRRFVEAQEPVFASVLAELRRGRKASHWMWFVFPQFVGLGRSPTSRHFAIESLAEARAYLAHPVLGPRLREATELVNAVGGRSALDIFGSPDDLKFRSSMTLFSEAAGADGTVFRTALDRYYDGDPDPATLTEIQRRGQGAGASSTSVP
ncbi:DUF1810 domain-containing protein [Mangrovicella endophytica]|uniref:DUF1810 domain-containing protein n=1 Tax=Mangrovicella endophytica TaxID=2066697 RepID=UPI000C9DD561|nr:DUF1810 domain-containing protein [Mangrovicella endophytica]